jgi:hypothetical protein
MWLLILIILLSLVTLDLIRRLLYYSNPLPVDDLPPK